MDKLPPELRILAQQRLARAKSTQADADTLAAAAGEPETITVALEFRDSLDPLVALGFEVLTQAGTVAYGRATLAELEAISRHPNVVGMDVPEEPEISLDKSIPNARANLVWTRGGDEFTGMTGDGVIVGVIDTGIDYQHHTFRKADGSTRILRIWDQTLTATGSESAPGPVNHATLGTAPLGYGVEYVDQSGDSTQPTIARALAAADPLTIVRHRDTDGHGTHVASTAAGDGSQNGNCHGSYHYIGVAPEASLIIVRMRGLTPGDSGTTGSEMIDAIRYIADRAGSTPCAVNLSLGTNLGSRKATMTTNSLDQILTAHANGFCLVFAAGNEGNKDRHAQATVIAGGSLVLTFQMPAAETQNLRMEVRYSGSSLRVTLQPPGGTASAPVASGSTTPLNGVNNGGNVTIGNTTDLIRLDFTPPSGGTHLAGTWTLNLENTGGSDVLFHAWSIQNRGPKFISNVNLNSSVSHFAAAANVIVVGAHASEGDRNDELAGFSGRGPILRFPAGDARNIVPHLTAPGVAITAAGLEKDRADDSCCACCKDYYVDLDGTSMATPHVTGAAALLLQQDGTLSFGAIRTRLRDSARADGISDALPNNDWGSGRLDVQAALAPVGPSIALAPGTETATGPLPAPPIETAAATSWNAAALAQGLPPDLVAMQDELLATEIGRRYHEILRAHFREVRGLVESNVRVAAAWHTWGGERLIDLAFECAARPDRPVPAELDAVPLAHRAQKMLAVLRRFGSAALIRTIDDHVHLLSLLRRGLTPRQMLDLVVERRVELPAMSSE